MPEKRDIHVVAVDETAAWHLPEYAKYIDKVFSIFCYDSTVGFHIAEFTRSYELWLIDQKATLKEGTPDHIAEEIDNLVSGSISWGDDGVDYMHAYTVDAMVEAIKKSGEEFRYHHYGEEDPNTSMEDIAQMTDIYDELGAREARETAEVESWTSDEQAQCSVCEEWFYANELDASERCNECRP